LHVWRDKQDLLSPCKLVPQQQEAGNFLLLLHSRWQHDLVLLDVPLLEVQIHLMEQLLALLEMEPLLELQMQMLQITFLLPL
jgi:hypothetical protein